MNYPTEEYESYAECDDDFVRRTLPPGLKPFWAVDNISEASNTYSVRTKHLIKKRYDYGKLTHINTSYISKMYIIHI